MRKDLQIQVTPIEIKIVKQDLLGDFYKLLTNAYKLKVKSYKELDIEKLISLINKRYDVCKKIGLTLDDIRVVLECSDIDDCSLFDLQSLIQKRNRVFKLLEKYEVKPISNFLEVDNLPRACTTAMNAKIISSVQRLFNAVKVSRINQYKYLVQFKNVDEAYEAFQRFHLSEYKDKILVVNYSDKISESEKHYSNLLDTTNRVLNILDL